MYFCQKSEDYQKNYIKKLENRLARDGFTKGEVAEIIEILKAEKVANIPSLEAIEGGEDLW